jgi:AmmeMemoRadiSam system protein B/AmmeMemoRadiSam system protein A
MGTTRAAAVAGMFYPQNRYELASSVRRHLAAAETPDHAPKAIIAPHAGYIYSGATAGKAYAALKPAADTITRVVLLGPAHRVGFHGIAAPASESFETPMGKVAIDRAAIDSLADLSQIVLRDDAHREEHSLEVHLPFLQEVLGSFTLVPLVVGQCDGKAVAEVLDRLWGGPETLIVISSDLSHYEDYATAQRMDTATAEAIEDLRPDAIGPMQACGRTPIAGLLTVAKARHMTVSRIGLCNSGDTAGGRDRVVGYGAWRFDAAAEPDDRSLLDRHGAELHRVAAASIRHGLAKGRIPAVDVASFVPDLQVHRATFVTLKRHGRLRGCIGTIAAQRPLVTDVVENAYGAAFRDHRFPPLQESETQGLTLSISLLGVPQPMQFADEADFLAQLRPGTDGLIIGDNGRRAVFLPQVWEDLPDRSQFVTQLKRKAGMTPDHWSDSFAAWRFTSTSTHP